MQPERVQEQTRRAVENVSEVTQHLKALLEWHSLRENPVDLYVDKEQVLKASRETAEREGGKPASITELVHLLRLLSVRSSDEAKG